MSSQQSVYTGFWTNWAEGQILGTTLTLSARDGAYLIAILALFVKVTGGFLWRIISFVLFRNSPTSGWNGLFHQQQAILRNSTSGGTALFQFLQSAWCWREKAKSTIPRSMRLALLAAIHIAIFAIAGAFSSRVAVTDSQVLLVSPNCGLWSFLSQNDEDRVSYRQVSTCTPLDIRNRITGFQPGNASLLGDDHRTDPTLQWQSLLLGQSWVTGGDATFSFSNATINSDARLIGSIGESQPYTVDVEQYHTSDADSYYGSSFQPIDGLVRNDSAAISLFILINNAGYDDPVEDPWFNATRFQNSVYSSEQIFQVLGCSSEYLVCRPQVSGSPICGHVANISASVPTVYSEDQRIDFNVVQNTLLPRFTAATTRNAMTHVPQFLGADSLLASSYVYQWSSLDLPDDQWTVELSNWFSTSLISLQLFSASYVQSDTPQWSSFSKISPSAGERWMCTNQIVHRDDHTSFSVLGLSIVLGVGCIIILISLILKDLVTWIQSDTEENDVRTQTWTELGLLQLQRKVLETSNPTAPAWVGEGDVPTVSSGESFEMDLRPSSRHDIEQGRPFISKSTGSRRAPDATTPDARLSSTEQPVLVFLGQFEPGSGQPDFTEDVIDDGEVAEPGYVTGAGGSSEALADAWGIHGATPAAADAWGTRNIATTTAAEADA
ncbi:hypothetical protein KCU77_g839, partial [Aureobasidium melanogenum]